MNRRAGDPWLALKFFWKPARQVTKTIDLHPEGKYTDGHSRADSGIYQRVKQEKGQPI
jgi:hypothetical protein